MKAKELYKKLDDDFEIDKFTDEWPGINLGDYVSENFQKRQMGVFIDNSEEIKKVYTAVFPTDEIIEKVLAKQEEDILLFVHHPQIWDTSLEGFPFKDFDKELLPRLKENRISIYNLHSPLDDNGKYSTTMNMARAFGIEKEEDFFEYQGGVAGVIGKTNFETLDDLADRIIKEVGHEVKVLNYGSQEIKNQKVGLIAGGGNEAEAIEKIANKGINTYLTGVINKNESYQPSIDFHEAAKKYKINVIGATHYSTEKFACMAMCEYFKKLGLACEFLEGEPDMFDLG